MEPLIKKIYNFKCIIMQEMQNDETAQKEIVTLKILSILKALLYQQKT